MSQYPDDVNGGPAGRDSGQPRGGNESFHALLPSRLATALLAIAIVLGLAVGLGII